MHLSILDGVCSKGKPQSPFSVTACFKTPNIFPCESAVQTKEGPCCSPKALSSAGGVTLGAEPGGGAVLIVLAEAKAFKDCFFLVLYFFEDFLFII